MKVTNTGIEPWEFALPDAMPQENPAQFAAAMNKPVRSVRFGPSIPANAPPEALEAARQNPNTREIDGKDVDRLLARQSFADLVTRGTLVGPGLTDQLAALRSKGAAPQAAA